MPARPAPTPAKVDTHIGDYSFALERFMKGLHRHDDAIRNVPYMKVLATQLRDGRFDPDRALDELRRNPNLAAGIMETSLTLLLKYGAVEPVQRPNQRVIASNADIDAAARAMHVDAAEREPRTTAVMDRIAGEIGLELSLDHRFEVRSAVAGRAIRRPEDDERGFTARQASFPMATTRESLEQAILKVNDALRYSLIHRGQPDQFIVRYRQCLQSLSQAGFHKIKVVNSFHGESRTAKAYAGLNLTFEDPDGKRLEVQFHTGSTNPADPLAAAGSFELKKQFHDDYKESFDLQMKGVTGVELKAQTQQARDALREFRRHHMPPNIDAIQDWEYEPPPVEADPTVRRNGEGATSAGHSGPEESADRAIAGRGVGH